MKEIDKSKNSKSTYLRELNVLKQLVHQNIVKYVGCPDESLYNSEHFVIFMEYCENGTLKNGKDLIHTQLRVDID